MRQKIYLFSLLLCIVLNADAQRFSASVLLGSNFAQIDGDDLAGFNKLGISAGILTEYELKPHMKFSVELLFNQTGSKSALSFGKAPGVEFIQTSYIDIPIIFRLNDWKINDEFYKVFLDGGLSLGRLFSTEAQNSFFTGLDTDFTKTNLAFCLGGGIRFSKQLGITGRFTRSINSLYTNDNFLARSLFGYFLTFRFEYKL